MKRTKNQAKRTLAVLLSVVMLMSAWVFAAPAAGAADHTHVFNVRQTDGLYHWMKCATCDEIANKEAHTGTATCIAPATCEVCGESFGLIDLTNHATTETVLEDAKDPGYTYTGFTGDRHCTACGEIVQHGEIIPKLSLEDNAAYALANRIVAAPDKYSPSDVANVNEKLGAVNAALTAENNDEAVIAALAALEAVVETVETVGPFRVTFIVGGEVVDEQTIEAGEAATPPEVPEYVYQGDNHKHFTGWSQDYTRILTDIVITPVYVEEAHDWQDSTVIRAATCVQTGSQRINCACGATDTKVLPIDADYHTGNTVTTRENEVAATCSAEGSYVEVVKCECGLEIHRTTRTIAKLPHTPGETVREDVEVSCNEPAGYYDVVYCSVCGEEASRTKHDSGEALGHNWSDWKVTSEATCTAEGSKTRTCARCGETETAVLAKTAHPDANGDKVCDSCGYVFPDHSHKDADNNNVCDGCGAVIDTSARCSWCSINDKWEGTIFVGWIVAFIHLFVHLAQTSKFK